MHTWEQVMVPVNWLRERIRTKPRTAIVLGTGLGGLAGEIERRQAFPYDQIPGFVQATATSHKGELVFGELDGVPVVAMEGRYHFYEGYSLDQITLPVRVMRALGAELLIVSNAAGGMNPLMKPGEIVLIDDHINLMGVNPLVGPNDDRLGTRFPDMCRPYDPALLDIAERAAVHFGVRARRGIYVALTGPCLETRAEYRFLRLIGADCVGMSTVPEVIVGVHCGFRILGLSVITDQCFPDVLEPVDIDRIIATAQAAEPGMKALIRGVLRKAFERPTEDAVRG
ncbi:MAG: purine-nucleoside phosphorylase [Candidatus Brocadiae bacterium]|nr:purine-nucleoside phosphorylase [Candidatus Brocadiia bacterium]